MSFVIGFVLGVVIGVVSSLLFAAWQFSQFDP